jgi:hypothetical protein
MRRCEVLHCYGVYFLWRNCCGYLYLSQEGDRLDKLLEGKRRIGARIFEHWNGVDGWPKRKGVHWTIFERELRRYRDTEARWSQDFSDRAGAMLGT